MVDGKTQTCSSGDFVKIPSGAVHAFTCTYDAPGRLLCIDAPGRIQDAFFTEAGDAMPNGTTEVPPPGGPPDIPALMAEANRLGITILPSDGAPA